MFDLGGFEQRTVEIGNVGELFLYFVVAVVGLSGQDGEEKVVQIIKIFNLFGVEKGKRLVALVVFYQLCLEQFKEKDSVDPGN